MMVASCAILREKVGKPNQDEMTFEQTAEEYHSEPCGYLWEEHSR